MADVTSTFAAKDVGFSATVNRMQRTLAGFQSGIAGFGMKVAGLAATFVSVQAAMSAFRNGLDMAGRLNDLSKTTGETAGNLATLERAFQNNGMAAEQVGVSLAKMSEFIVGLRSGSESASKAAAAMGISLSDLAGKSPIQQMQAIMQAIAGIRDPALRTATAVDVFGRSGRAVVPLASEFSGEIANARSELGSLVPILDANSASLDELGDKLQNAVGNKLNEVAIGFAAGITGANNFVDALAKIDAAGFGKQLGDSLRIAFDAPLETAKAIGYTLLTGIKQAGNNLMNAFSTAVSFFQNLFSNAQYWSGLGQRVQAMFMESINAFNKLLLSAVEGALLRPLSNLPGILGDPFRAALETTNEIRDSLESASKANADNLAEGGAKIQEAIQRAAENTAVIEKDWFGVEQSAADAARHFLDAEQRSNTIRDNAEKTADNFGKGSAALRDALAEVRGFDLTPKSGPEERPDWFKSNQPPPKNEPTPSPASGNTGRSSTSSPKSQSALDQLRQRAETDPSAAAQLSRIMRDQMAAENRAASQRDMGAFYSAASTEQRARERAERAAAQRNALDFVTDQFGGNNMAEAFRNYLQDLREAGMSTLGRTQKDFEEWAREQSKTPAERKRAEEQAASNGAGASPAAASPMSAVQNLISQIYDVLAGDDGIRNRLPIRVMSAA